MHPEIIIRKYESCDRESVRQISCDTADKGNPVENFFMDRKIIANLLTCYYTDYEPESLWVGECSGKIVGYLTGCLDSRRQTRLMMYKIEPKIILNAIIRGIFFRSEIWRLLWAGLKTWQKGGFPRHIDLVKYPAQLHVNIMNGYRGRHIGELLVEKFISQVRIKGVKGIHFGVRSDNAKACRFFEKLGFMSIKRYPAVFPYGKGFQTHYTVIYGKEIL